MPAAIAVRGLTKNYGATRALAGLDVEVANGGITGLVGPNGAGKSTFFKVLLGLVRPDGGSASVLGLDASSASLAIRRRVGYLPGDVGFYPRWTGSAWLAFHLAWHPRASLADARDLAARFELPLERRIRGYSSGMRQKLAIVQALASGADLLLLDEPTKGLDPTSQATFLDLVARERERGRTLVLSSHVLDEVERACDRVLFLDRGSAVDEATIETLRGEFRRRLRVRASSEAIARIAELPFVRSVESDRMDRRDAWVEVDAAAEDLPGAVAALLAAGAESLEYNRPSLEDIYRRLYLARDAGSSERARC